MEEFRKEYKDYTIIGRFTDLGFRCGYVSLTEKQQELLPLGWDPETLDVHGGVTCVRTDAETKHLIVGFDCGHLYDAPDVELLIDRYPETLDFIPQMLLNREGTIRTEEYVISECKRMVDQIIALSKAEGEK